MTWWRFGLLLATVVALWLSTCCHGALAQVPPGAARYRADLVRTAHSQWGLDAPIPAMAAQVQQESGWNAAAVSQVGARGMAQFMPATASWWCEINGINQADCQPANPVWALRALVGYDKWLWDKLPNNLAPFDRMWAVLRAYNGGLGNWQREAAAAGSDLRQDIDAACGRARRSAQHCPENLGYPQRILVRLQPLYQGWGLML